VSINYVIGDATAPVGSGDKVIAHICNDQGVWGAGFVMALHKKWPMLRELYQRAMRQAKAGEAFTIGPLRLGEVQWLLAGRGITVANMIAQRMVPDDEGKLVDYAALEACLENLADGLLDGESVHMPRIGTGIGGGTWEPIEKLITQNLVDLGVSVTVYDLPPKESVSG
jgi:O-acetyl-ADP-ribose deacetylase (regulator of RNase III)